MAFTYKIIVGDWSGDGHDQTESFLIETNASAGKIRDAYKKAEFSLTDAFAEDGDNLLSEDELEQLKDNGIDLDKVCYEDRYGQALFNPEAVAQLYLEMARSQLSDLEYEFVDDKIEVLVEGIGYGCF